MNCKCIDISYHVIDENFIVVLLLCIGNAREILTVYKHKIVLLPQTTEK